MSKLPRSDERIFVSNRFSFRCSFSSWMAGWAVAVFLPSAAIAYLGLSESAASIGEGFNHLLSTTWKVADDVGPLAKLMIGALLALFNIVAFVATLRNSFTHAIACASAGVLAVVLTLLLIPAEYSRGFGIGLTGARIDQSTLPIYAVCGLVAGLVLSAIHRRCAHRQAAGAA
jgi:hypothetical protein